MPIYVFKHPTENVEAEVYQKMNDPHVFIDDNGLEWGRVWKIPNASVDSQQLDGSKEGFMKYTENKRGNIGDLWDASKECSEIREKKHGKDEVREKHFKKYKEKNKIKHIRDE